VAIYFDAFPDYYRGKANIDHLVFRTILDPSALIIALENGEVDFVDTPIISARKSLMENPKVFYDESIQACYYLIAFNNQKGHFTDKKVREAVSYAIDRNILIQGALEGVGKPVYQAMVPICFSYDADFKAHPYDLEKAKELMTESSYPDGFTVSMPTMPGGTYGTPTEILQSMLAEIGINIEVDFQERGTWMSEVLTNNNYEITFWAVPITVNDPDLADYATFHSKNINGGGNFTNTLNTEIDKLLEEGRLETDPGKRNAIYDRIAEIVRDESYLIPLYTGTRRIATQKGLKNVKADPVLKYYVYEWSW
jgi:peptide/nickel transport system substrate-binding protein